VSKIEIFSDRDQFIIKSEIKDRKDTGGILDTSMGVLAYFKHTHSWKNPGGSRFNIGKQAKTTDVVIEATDKTLLGEIHEIPPPLMSLRLIRKFRIHNNKEELIAVVREKPKFMGSDWVLENPKEEVIAITKGKWKKKNYEIISKEKHGIARVFRDSSLDKDSYKVSIFGSDIDLFLILCYVVVLDLAKGGFTTREGLFYR
jgi:uncharacterized protein YxjI